MGRWRRTDCEGRTLVADHAHAFDLRVIERGNISARRGESDAMVRSSREEAIVDVTPRPFLARLDRGNDRVVRGVEVLRRVAVR